MSLVDEARSVRERIAERLRELEPLVREYNELQQIAAQMGFGSVEPSSVAARGNAVVPGTSASPAADVSSGPAALASGSATRRPRAGRPARQRTGAHASETRSGGELTDRVLAVARSDPGKTVADYAEMLGVAPTSLYRPVRQLTSEGALVKRARQLFPA